MRRSGEMPRRASSTSKTVPTPGLESADTSPAAEWVPLGALLPWVENPRRNDAAVDPVARSMLKFGFGAPILARRANGEVIAGHTRLKAALKLGMDRVPVRYLDLTEKQAHQLALADNRLGENAEWNDEMLSAVLRQFDQGDLGDLGFSSSELEVLLPSAEQVPILEGDEGIDFHDPGRELLRIKVAINDGQSARAVVRDALAGAGIEFTLE